MDNVLYIIPHSGIHIPPEIRLSDINQDAINDINKVIDRDTDKLYDIGNKIVFPYLRALIDVNQYPLDMKNSVPTQTENGTDIYSVMPNRLKLVQYHNNFHSNIGQMILRNQPSLIIDCHSTYTDDKDDFGDRFESDICISNFQETSQDHHGYTKHCPDELFIRFHNRMKQQFNSISMNTKYLTKTYGYTEEFYSKNFKIPVILIEINENLYRNKIDDVRNKLKVAIANV